MPLSALEGLKDAVGRFSDAKFGVNRHFSIPLEKLKEEIGETIKSEGHVGEFADMLICLLDAYRLRYAVHTNHLIEQAQEKLIRMEKEYVWNPPDENGNVSHVNIEVEYYVFMVDTENNSKFFATKNDSISDVEKMVIEKKFGKIIRIYEGLPGPVDKIIVL